eukprot:Hpha_TRINITY_DN25938_c0_g1::TRINITY_DN25938_c0_g1_i1::g.185259::m.185259
MRAIRAGVCIRKGMAGQRMGVADTDNGWQLALRLAAACGDMNPPPSKHAWQRAISTAPPRRWPTAEELRAQPAEDPEEAVKEVTWEWALRNVPPQWPPPGAELTLEHATGGGEAWQRAMRVFGSCIDWETGRQRDRRGESESAGSA